jgi:hypothetical protein
VGRHPYFACSEITIVEVRSIVFAPIQFDLNFLFLFVITQNFFPVPRKVHGSKEIFESDANRQSILLFDVDTYPLPKGHNYEE